MIGYILLLIASLTVIQVQGKGIPYCKTVDDCIRIIGPQCSEEQVTCGCEKESWCSLKRACDPEKNGTDCTISLPDCMLQSMDNKYYCGRILHPFSPGTFGST